MLRSAITTLFLFFILTLSAQFTVSGNASKMYHNTYSGIDYLVVINGIDPVNSAIIYNGSGANNVKWYTFDNPSTEIALQTPNENYNISDATGYFMKDASGKVTTFWVIDYKNIQPDLGSVEPVTGGMECEELYLKLQVNIPKISYKTLTGETKLIDRKFTLSYPNMEWSSSAWKDNTESSDIVLTTATSQVQVPVLPLKNTVFTLSGDQFAVDLGLTYKVSSQEYAAVKSECHIISKASVRVETNEENLPDVVSVTTASGPVEIVFASNANLPVTRFFDWNIFKDNSLILTRNDQDLRYTFAESGSYKVKVTTSSSKCLYSDSIMITVVESGIEVPRAFTPNGDGKNDEFRIAYKSLSEFRCWVFNRWQQQVYYWNDPQKGWDGTINGRPAKPGAYFYIIEAVGTDGVKYKRKGDINLLR